MIQTLKDIERTLDENDARRKSRGHNGLTIDDLRAINKLRENDETLQREREERGDFMPPPWRRSDQSATT